MQQKLARLILMLHLVLAGCSSDNSGTDPVTTSSSPVCGNGILEGNEACDDGNNVSGDGCTMFCSLEGGFVLMESSATTQLPSVNHNQGTDCISCHNGITRFTHWTASGTVYSSSSGITPLSGVTVDIIDSNSGISMGTVMSDLNGNFYTNNPVFSSGTITAAVSGGGSSGLSMSTVITLDSANTATGGGSCNQTGCHETGSGTGTLY